MEDFPAQPCRPNGIHRFLYRSDHYDEGPVRVYRPGTRSSEAAALQCDRASDRSLTAQQIVEAFADREAARYLIRDRDSRYSAEVLERLEQMNGFYECRFLMGRQ